MLYRAQTRTYAAVSLHTPATPTGFRKKHARAGRLCTNSWVLFGCLTFSNSLLWNGLSRPTASQTRGRPSFSLISHPRASSMVPLVRRCHPLPLHDSGISSSAGSGRCKKNKKGAQRRAEMCGKSVKCKEACCETQTTASPAPAKRHHSSFCFHRVFRKGSSCG